MCCTFKFCSGYLDQQLNEPMWVCRPGTFSDH